MQQINYSGSEYVVMRNKDNIVIVPANYCTFYDVKCEADSDYNAALEKILNYHHKRDLKTYNKIIDGIIYFSHYYDGTLYIDSDYNKLERPYGGRETKLIMTAETKIVDIGYVTQDQAIDYLHSTNMEYIEANKK